MTDEIKPAGEVVEAQATSVDPEVAKLKAENERLTNITRSQERIISKHKGYDRSLADLQAQIAKRDKDHALEMAKVRDTLRKGGIADDAEPESEYARTQRQFAEKEAVAPQPQMDPVDARKMAVCVDIMEELGIKPGSAEFEKLDRECPDVDDLLPVLKTRLKEAHAKDALEALKVEAAKKQKESGVTKGDGGPSAPGTASFTRAQIGKMSYAEYKAHEKEIDAAYREGRVT
jgi:hypothetical protein